LAEAQAAAPAARLELRGPHVVATGVGYTVRGAGAQPGARVRIEVRRRLSWSPVAAATADAGGRFERTIRSGGAARRYVLRAKTADGTSSHGIMVRARDVTLAAVGDVNLGDGPGAVIAQLGLRYPWTGVARTLRRADIAFGNLECSVSTRGRPVPKEFNFRGRPAALRTMARYAGFDAVNLANNHTGDFGTAALLDTVKNVRRFGIKAIGAGGSIGSASEPRVIDRLGLSVAFVGFSDILPASFFAAQGRPAPSRRPWARSEPGFAGRDAGRTR
jgi:hypothetical protein